MDLHGFFGLTLLQDPCACRQLLEGKFLYVHSYWKLGLQSPELNVSKGSMEWSISGRKWQPTSIPRAWKWLDIKQYVAWPTWRVEILYELYQLFSSTDARVIWTLPGEWTGSVHDLTKLLNMLVFELGESAKLLALTPYAPLDWNAP